MWDNLQLLFVWAPIINVQVILDGIFVGAVFALSAYGLALVWGVMNIKNLAQGDFVIMGGYLAFALHAYHVPLVLILLISGYNYCNEKYIFGAWFGVECDFGRIGIVCPIQWTKKTRFEKNSTH